MNIFYTGGIAKDLWASVMLFRLAQRLMGPHSKNACCGSNVQNRPLGCHLFESWLVFDGIAHYNLFYLSGLYDNPDSNSK